MVSSVSDLLGSLFISEIKEDWPHQKTKLLSRIRHLQLKHGFIPQIIILNYSTISVPWSLPHIILSSLRDLEEC